MRNTLLLAPVLAGFLLVPIAQGAPFASAVLSYNPGAGYAAGYTNTAAILGQPATNNVQPFDPPYKTSQILSIGAGGWLTVEFDHPIVHYPNTTRDFIIFGNSFFIETEDDTTDGDIYNNGGVSLVSVSRDGTNFYTLNPAVAPTVNALYPTDGTGNLQTPVDPSLVGTNFTGLNLQQIRLLYNGSAGGASYDVAWAQDTNGNPVALPDFQFVRIDVITNRAQVAGFAAIEGTVVTENFSNSPAGDGWRTTGDASLFSWDSTNQQLDATWDSTQTNSYFYHALGTILTTNDAFSLTFDLTLNDASVPTNSYQFEAALGLLNLEQATNANFLRGTGDNATNLAELDYFPPDSFGDSGSIDATLLDSVGNYSFYYDDVPLNPGTAYHVMLRHAAGTSLLTGEILTNGQVYTALPQFYGDGAQAFQLDTVAIDNYSAADSGGSGILAHGAVKNIFLTAPPPPVAYLGGQFTNGQWQAQFWSRTNWNYALLKSSDLMTWTSVLRAVPGTGGQMELSDPATNGPAGFYRVSATPQ